jgi:tape measure domain-containing protein
VASNNITLRMRLINARQTLAELTAVERQLATLERRTTKYGLAAARAGERSWLMNQALFTMRRYAYAATLALTATAGYAVKLGYDYYTAVQTTTLALTRFLHSHKLARNEVNLLYRIAARTPFRFPEISLTARRLMGFGLSLRDTNRTIVNITDALSALGVVSEASLNRASLALGHMYSLGRVTGQVVYQLARDNVPMIQALETELGLTADQLKNVGQLGIPAQVAFDALNKFIEGDKRYHGMGWIMATRSLSGLLSTFKDIAAQTFGVIETPILERIRRVLGGSGRRTGQGGLVNTFQQMSQAFASGGWHAMIDVLQRSGPIGGAMAPILREITADAIVLARVFTRSLVPAIRAAWHVAMILLIPLGILTAVLRQVAGHTTLLRIVLTYLVVVWTAERIAAMYAAIWTMRNGIAMVFLRRQAVLLKVQVAILNVLYRIRLVRIKQITTAEALQSLGMKRMAGMMVVMSRLWSVLTTGMVRGAGGQFVALTRLEKLVLRLRIAVMVFSRTLWASTLGIRLWMATLWAARGAMVSFLLTNPVGWAILLVSVLITLYFTWNRFHDAVNRTARFIWRWFPLITVAFAPMIAGLVLLIRHMRDLARWAQNAVRWIGRIHLPGGGLLHRARGLLGHIPGLATGGTVVSGGAAIVGERGPELTTLPAGATVSPLASGAIGSLPRFPEEINMRVILRVDGRDLADTVFKHRLDRLARA